jgi:hypothetical protein
MVFSDISGMLPDVPRTSFPDFWIRDNAGELSAAYRLLVMTKNNVVKASTKRAGYFIVISWDFFCELL